MDQMMSDPDSIDWIFTVHLKDFAGMKADTRSAFVSGNEDCPTRIQLYQVEQPSISHDPFAVFVQDANGNLKREDMFGLKEYAFDVKLTGALRFKATSVEQAMKAMRDALDCASANLGEILGQTIVAEVSLADEPQLFEVDGEHG